MSVGTSLAAAPTRAFLTVGDRTMPYACAGRGEVVLLLLAGDPARPATTALVASLSAGLRVIAPEALDSLPDASSALESFVEGLGVRVGALVAEGVLCDAALAFARLHESVRRVVLFSPRDCPDAGSAIAVRALATPDAAGEDDLRALAAEVQRLLSEG